MIACFACKSEKNTNALDLMKHGLPIKINAPADAEVEMTDYGFAKDVTVKAGEEFDIQILSGEISGPDIASIKRQKLLEVKDGAFFSKVVEEFDDGFIFEKKISDTKLKYDFRSVKLQGDKEYVFQSGLMGDFDEAQIRQMYEAVK